MASPATTFDTLAAARDLKAAGVEPAQAEAFAEALRKAATADRDELATRADIRALEARLEARLDRLLLQLGGVVIAAAGLTVALVKLL